MELCYLLMESLMLFLLLALAPPGADEDGWQSARQQMVAEIEADVDFTSRRIGRSSLDPGVMEAMGRVPRHEFVPESLRHHAYENRPLPIGYGQTISQPYIVALMTDLLAVTQGDKVLEVGTGSGYQAAVLAQLGLQVYSIEIIPELAESARVRLARLGLQVDSRVGDGYHGWQEQAPFDAIIVTAAASHIPPPLVQQLAPGGVMIIPVGGPFTVQQLTLVEKAPNGQVKTRQVLPVAFVPLTGDR
jgi:protein-L-isoaspartate(D-aspartate) O-methyltransferase